MLITLSNPFVIYLGYEYIIHCEKSMREVEGKIFVLMRIQSDMKRRKNQQEEFLAANRIVTINQYNKQLTPMTEEQDSEQIFNKVQSMVNE